MRIIDTKIEPMPLSSFRKGLCGLGYDVLAVKFNFKWGLLSSTLLCDAALCPKMDCFTQFYVLQKNFMEIAFFGKRLCPRAKFKKKDLENCP